MPIDFSYNERLEAGYPGAIVNTEPKTLISRTVETATGIGFGVPVSQGANDNGVTTTAGNTDVLGVTVWDRTTDPETPDTFGQYRSARIMTKGVVWVRAGEAVAAGDPVCVTAADGTFKKTATGNLTVANARYDSSAAIGELVKLRLA
ncbi:structural cement protein Gp24 [Profundibacterium mesophilum]|uniref:Uncharacterized protein n=1 Tax=Profundibacterium mesophilum KAUST100406-0324 TaxID=1037889 RepID=A0A921NPX9_9RHOB|nr:capsid cement protein [Profundibacterium mesophilum]KAF0675080.1 hypothetical protein PMES_02601 [Profundibacterium mesophilum KAUST100406-0324]